MNADKVIQKGDILFCMSSGSKHLVGKNILIQNTKNEYTFGAFCSVFRKSSDLAENEYVSLFLKSPEYKTAIFGSAQGANIKNLKGSHVEAMKIPVPPLTEQKRIVAQLDALFSRIDQTIAQLQHTQTQTKALWASALDTALNPFTTKPLQELLSQPPRNGWSPPAKNHSVNGTPVLTLSAVTGFRFRPESIKYTDAPTKRDAHYWVKDGDLLITRSNTPLLVGHAAIARIQQPTICPDLIIKMRVNEAAAKVEFIHYALQTTPAHKYMTREAKGASTTMKKINKAVVQNMPIPAPPLPEQEKIVAQLDAIAERTQTLEATTATQLEQLKTLKASLLDAAFRGQL